jgi:hypothetical protein
MQAFCSLLLLFFLCIPVIAQFARNPPNSCREGFFTRESDTFRVGTVTKARTNFFADDRDDCPAGKNCAAKAYLVSGDKVVVSRTLGDFVCSWFVGVRNSGRAGWLRTSDLNIVEPPAKVPLSAWLGDWDYYDNRITFTNNKLSGYLNVTGNAVWKGLGDNVHVGELDDRAQPKGNVLKCGEAETDGYACLATMRLIGEFLVVADNMNCGGANVSFSGVYKRSRKYN